MVTTNPTNATVYSLAWPIAMNALLQQGVLIIDTILVGGLGEEALTAMGIAVSIAGVIMGVLFALANGTQILLAQAFGASSERALKSSFWSGLIIGAIVAAVGVIVIFLLHDTIVSRLAKTEQIAYMASSYLLIFTIVIAGIALCQNISVFFYATGKPKLPFFSKLLELPLNAAVSYMLIYGVAGMPELGVAGAAIGSAAAVLLRALFLVACLFYFKYELLLADGWSQNSIRATVTQHLRNALPIAATFISMNLSFTVCTMAYTQLGIYEFAALSILFIWVRSSGLLATSWAQATGILVGHLLGQNRIDQLDYFVGMAWRVALALGVVIAILYGTTPFLFNVIYPNLQDQTRAVIWSLLPILITLPLVRTSNTICGNVLRAGGQAGYAFKVHVMAQWLFTVPATLLAVFVFELPVVWVFSIVLLEEVLKALPFHLRMYEGSWKRRLVVD